MFISKTICNKPYTTNQKQKKLKQKNKIHEIKKKEMKKREKTLLKKYRFLILNSRLFPIPARRNARG
jgi:hypothetical protein